MSRALLMIRPEPSYRRQAFESGLRRLGYTMLDHSSYGRERPKGRDDLLVVWNIRRGTDERYAARWEQLGGTVVVAENGYLQQRDKTYYALSVHGHNGSGWFPMGDDDRLSRLGFELQPPRTGGEYVLVRDQRGIGSESMRSPRGWGAGTAERMRRSQPLPVRLMPHPGDDRKIEADAQALAGAARVVIWASAIGVRALVEGIPVEHHAPHWICEHHATAGREAALQRMAHGQWHFDEVASGEPFARMRSHAWGPKWH